MSKEFNFEETYPIIGRIAWEMAKLAQLELTDTDIDDLYIKMNMK